MMTPEQIKIYREMSPAKKVEIIARIHHDARALKAAAFRMNHPEWTDDQVKQAVKEWILYASW